MNHEQAYADAFNKYMEQKARSCGYSYQFFSVDGQDRDVGGDYVISDSNRFTLVEFKYLERDCLHESRKKRRLELCKGLVEREDMRNLHDKCHFISWIDSQSDASFMHIYRKVVCNQGVFGATCGLEMESAELETCVPVSEFSDQFFQPISMRSLSLMEFDRYVAWVMTKTSGSIRTTLELMTFDIYSRELTMVRLPSIERAHQWMQNHRPQRTPSSSPSSDGPSP